MSGPRGSDVGRTGGGMASAFAVECPTCRAHLAVARGLVGRVAGCPRCRAAFVVPAPGDDERRPSRPEAAAPRRPAPVVAVTKPRETAQPQPAPTQPQPAFSAPDAPVRSPDEPLILSEPPVPSTRRRRDAAAFDVTPAVGLAATALAEAVIPTPDMTPMAATAPAVATDAPDGLAFRDPVRTIRSGGAEIELRRLTPEEKRVRRSRRNLIILVVGAALLVALVVILGKGAR